MSPLRAALAGPRAWRPRGWRFALAIALLLFALPLLADDFEVVDVQTRLDGDTYVLDARIDFDFSDRALEALDNGVPLTLEVHIQVRPTNDWIWEASLVDQRLRYRVRYKPLSESYLVAQLPGETGRTFVTRDAAVAALGDIRGLQLLGKERLDPEQDYEVHLRVSLDIEELPLPLRPMAYLYPSWKQSSKWTKWPLKP
jgi:hypothetical protein